MKRRIKIPLFYKITLSFIGLIIGLAIIVIVSGKIAQAGMRTYFEDVIEERFERLINQGITEAIDKGLTLEEMVEMEELFKFTRPDGVHIEIYDMDGHLLFASNRGGVDKLLENKYVGPSIKGLDPKYVEKSLPIIIDDEEVGVAKARFYDASMMKPNDFLFFETMASVFNYSLIAVVLLTLMMSFLIARSITKPISKVARTAYSISEGELNARSSVDTSTKELIELSESINSLASKLEEEDVLRMQVTSDMAHEIRTPLTSLRNFFEAFMDGVYEVNDENLLKCHNEIIRMSELVDRLKDIASIEEMTIKANMEEVDLAVETNSICDLTRPVFEKEGINLKLAIEEGILMTMDANHYKQIVTNLISNGIRYTDKGGTVNVSLKKEGLDIRLSVSDTGVGISEEDQKHIFERFFRADKSRDRATGGLGVGLTIVKKMVDYHKGQIDLQSELGVGTNFTIIFKTS